MTEYGEFGSFEEHQNESKGMNLKNSNDMKRIWPPRGEPKWGSAREVGTTPHQILAAALFAIHVVMQWISFKSIAKYSIVTMFATITNSDLSCKPYLLDI
jgi:hypothetical protein